ncbi:MAG: class I SAM-dependent methyltransferase [Clostridia bacterium]|nr:class I SAM-dependent methyltransferase [Clostridia bacterium]
MKSYSILSKFYDNLMKDFPYNKYLDYIMANSNGKNCVDLFCGSGRMTVLLASKGYSVQGVDCSPEMLNCAAIAAKESGQNIIFRQEKAECFSYLQKLDLITAVCDGINYLPLGRLNKLFCRIKEALATNGAFIFDISSHYKLTKVLSNNIFFEDNDNLTYIWRNSLTKNAGAVNMDISFFIKDGNNYIRGDEKHRQYCHTVTQLKKALVTAGLTVAELIDGDTFKAAAPKSKRIIFLVKHKKYI